jgi:hypothetical protein
MYKLWHGCLGAGEQRKLSSVAAHRYNTMICNVAFETSYFRNQTAKEHNRIYI